MKNFYDKNLIKKISYNSWTVTIQKVFGYKFLKLNSTTEVLYFIVKSYKRKIIVFEAKFFTHNSFIFTGYHW